MTYKQKLDEQITFAQNKMLEAELLERHGERYTWSGYIQGLRYALVEYAEPQQNEVPSLQEALKNVVLTKQCSCDHTDLQPLGECICGAAV